MYVLARGMLLLAMLLLAYCIVLAAILEIHQHVPPDKQSLVWALLIVGVIVIAVRKKGRWLLTSGGTAAWASIDQLMKAGMLHARKGLILGRVPSAGAPLGQAISALRNVRLSARDACRAFCDSLNPRKRKQGQLVRLPSTSVHVSVYAPTGVGKGVSLIVPFLLTCDESCVIVDGKDGELAHLTAAARRRMGHQVILLDPSRVVTPKPDTLNILDFTHKNSPRAVNEAAAIANALVIRTGQEKEPHFLDRAEHWLKGLIALAIWHGQREHGTRSLLRVADIVSNPEALKYALQLMRQHPEIWDGSLTRMGGMMGHSMGDELGSILSTVGRFISFMDSPSVAESLRSSSFDLSKLRKKKMSIYLIQTAADTRTGSALMRLWLNACIREVMKGGLNQKRNVHVVIDEAGSIGRMDSIEDVLKVGRGFGLRMQLYYQDIGQLNKCWENPQGVLANTTKILFGTSDYSTAEILSKSLGSETIEVESGGSNSGWSQNHGHNRGGGGYSENSGSSTSGGTSSNWQPQSRELLKPDEVLQLDPRIAITLTPGVRPLWTRLIRYYEEKSLFKRRGWLSRLAAACLTLFLAAALLLLSAGAAVALTREFRNATAQQQIAPAAALPMWGGNR